MPEFPEVNVQVRYLRQRALGLKVSSYGVRTRQHLKGVEGAEREALIERFFDGNVIEDITQRGKQIIMHTPRGVLLSHLMFRGRWTLKSDPFVSNYKYHKDAPRDRDASLWMEGQDGTRLELHTPEYKAHALIFEGVRDASKVEKLAKLGPEVVSLPETDKAFGTTPWSLEAFTARAAKSRQAIKAFLLDQKRQSGLGNMYVCEGLYDAGISPHRPAKSLQEAELKAVWQAAQAVMRRAVETDLNYEEVLRIYRREADPGGHAVKVDKIGGRDTFWVPEVQK